ncbi:hypothetical protein [Komagataeibacter swingsii]|uniref:Tetratricopeptide repeat protein n=1 Tax=Komagataeibacter swingsii TaxID=215220 RepID=A0A850NWT3_9PROT|nr:hypothetical protein [Komagataeibacter swingsii]NVN36138.1 hypothetical protein [Komagataeibacter swingsii]
MLKDNEVGSPVKEKLTQAEVHEVTVTPLGTCRIAEPLYIASKHCDMQRNMSRVYGYVHTTKEILQLIECMEGRNLPDDMVPLIASERYEADTVRTPSDVYFVEISSMKEIHYKDSLLQLNCVSRVFEDHKDIQDIFFKHRRIKEIPERRQLLEKVPAFQTLSPLLKSIMLEGYVHFTTQAEVVADMQRIASMLGNNVVFVSHINVPGDNGELIASRNRLCGWIRAECQAHGYNYFDPTPLVTAHGLKNALAKQGEDNKHYATDFKDVLGTYLYEHYALPLATPGTARPIMTPDLALASGAAQPTPAAPAAPAASATPESRSAVSAMPAPTVNPDDMRIDAILADARAMVKRGEADEAEAMLRGASIDHPTNAEVFAQLGTIAYHRGDSISGLASLRHALDLNPKLVEPKILLVRIAQRLNRLEEACSLALELVTEAPDDSKALTAAAKAFVKSRRFQEAAAIWKRLAVLQPAQSMPLTEAARAELKGRNFEAAIQDADGALQRDRADVSALVIKAMALQRLKRMKPLAEVAMQIAEVDPGAAMGSVPTLVDAGHLEDAADVLARIRLKGHPAADDAVLQAGLVRSLIRRARLAAEQNNDVNAAAAWNGVLKIDPENRNAHSGIRKIVSPIVRETRRLVALGETDPAIALCRRGLSFDHANMPLQRVLAKALEGKQAWEESADAWEHYAHLTNPADGPSLLRAARNAARAQNWARSLQLFGQLPPEEKAVVGTKIESLTRKLVKELRNDFNSGAVAEAVSKADIVLGIDPQNEKAHRFLGKAVSAYRRIMKDAVQADDLERQEEFGRKILALAPNRVDALKVLSRVYRIKRQWRDAIAVQNHLTQQEPDRATHWRRLASFCRSGKDYDLGVQAALKAVELEPDNTRSIEFLSDILNRQAQAAAA